ncbi:MAG: VanZ family protein [Acidobacteriota bacterium]|jgi:VanZ family protein|nr:VanZ family protein [Acidobacteriota bacterium]
MLFLFVLSCALVAYGTLYPFDFTPGAPAGGVLGALASSLGGGAGVGDTFSNVVLFLPVGFFAMQSLLRRAPRVLGIACATLLGALFSFGIEFAQCYLPDRVPSGNDLALNTAGAFLGALAGCPDWRARLSQLRPGRPAALSPLLLVGAWLGYRLFPYVPTLDVQQVKDALKPLLSAGLPPLDIVRHLIVTLAAGRLLAALTESSRAFPAILALPLGVIAAKPFIMTKTIQPAEAVGVALGVLACWILFSRLCLEANGAIALLLALQIAIQGVFPFAVRDTPQMFSLIPFVGFEGGSMALNLQSFFEKTFLYGAMVWLAVESGWSLLLAVLSGVFLLTAIEFLQTFMDGRVSEVTDPLIAVILGAVFYFCDLRARDDARDAW